MIFNHHKKLVYDISISVNNLYLGYIFDKIEKISLKHTKLLNIGKVTSALTLDLVRLELFFVSNYYLLVAPLMFAIYTVFFIFELGYIGIIGVVLLMLIAVFMIYLSYLNSTFQK